MAKDHGPSIKDDEQYERLCEEGASKEKAAGSPTRAARPQVSAVANRPGTRSSPGRTSKSESGNSASRDARR